MSLSKRLDDEMNRRDPLDEDDSPDFPYNDAECSQEHPCIDCQWADKREAER